MFFQGPINYTDVVLRDGRTKAASRVDDSDVVIYGNDSRENYTNSGGGGGGGGGETIDAGMAVSIITTGAAASRNAPSGGAKPGARNPAKVAIPGNIAALGQSDNVHAL